MTKTSEICHVYFRQIRGQFSIVALPLPNKHSSKQTCVKKCTTIAMQGYACRLSALNMQLKSAPLSRFPHCCEKALHIQQTSINFTNETLPINPHMPSTQQPSSHRVNLTLPACYFHILPVAIPTPPTAPISQSATTQPQSASIPTCPGLSFPYFTSRDSSCQPHPSPNRTHHPIRNHPAATITQSPLKKRGPTPAPQI